ncbi:hypothetical protein ID866_9784 [Astraeus odoratus]|nr:hypothetical protein ID866_9784 [Astraeus odoratus]
MASSLPSKTWVAHLETKQSHFRAATQYRKSMDELEGNRYGDELRRLMDAEADAKRGYNLAKRCSAAPAVIQDIKSLVDVLQKNLDVSAVDAIQDVVMVKNNVPPGLLDPGTVIGSTDAILFGDMLSWAAREGVNQPPIHPDRYDDNKGTLVKERVVEAATELDGEADRLLCSLNLPASLEALERPIGLPPSLLKKAEEMRLEQGPQRIEAYLADIQRLARRAMDAMDILDSEASEDESARKHHPMSRPLSHEANQELVAKQQRYRNILLEAAQSDNIEVLEDIVPSSTVVVLGGGAATTSQTQTHARVLRGHLESLDQVKQDRSQLVARAQRLVEVDNINPSIIEAASRFDRWEELTPEMFVDVSDGGLAKYDRFIQGLAEGQKKQEGILETIRSINEQFLLSRKDDPAVKQREIVLHDLDMAYAKYREITWTKDASSTPTPSRLRQKANLPSLSSREWEANICLRLFVLHLNKAALLALSMGTLRSSRCLQTAAATHKTLPLRTNARPFAQTAPPCTNPHPLP